MSYWFAKIMNRGVPVKHHGEIELGGKSGTESGEEFRRPSSAKYEEFAEKLKKIMEEMDEILAYYDK